MILLAVFIIQLTKIVLILTIYDSEGNINSSMRFKGTPALENLRVVKENSIKRVFSVASVPVTLYSQIDFKTTSKTN
jgi:hypothetical protein